MLTEIGCFYIGLIVGGAGVELLRQWRAKLLSPSCDVCRRRHRAD